MSLITVDSAVRMNLLIKNFAPGGKQEVYKCVLCQCSISGSIPAQAHLHGIKHQKAFKKSLNVIGSQNSITQVVGPQVPSISKCSITKNSIPSLGVRPHIPQQPSLGARLQIPSLNVRQHIPQRFSSPQNSCTSVGSRPPLPLRFTSTHNSIPLGGSKCQIPVRSPGFTHNIKMPVRCSNKQNSNLSLGCRPQIPGRFPSQHNSISSLGARFPIPARFASTQNSVPLLGGYPQIPVRFSSTQNSMISPQGARLPQAPVKLTSLQIPSLTGKTQNKPIKFSSLQNSIPFLNKKQISNKSKSVQQKSIPAAKKQNISNTSISVKQQKLFQISNTSKSVKKQKFKSGNKQKEVKSISVKPKNGKITSLSVALGFASSAAEETEEENLVKAISLGIMKTSSDGNQYRCEVCSKSLNATSQAVQHVNGEPHQKKLRQHPKYKNLSLPPLISIPSTKISNVTSLNASHLNPNPKSKDLDGVMASDLDLSQRRLNMTSNPRLHLNIPKSISIGNSDDDIQKYIERGLVIVSCYGGVQMFKCNICNKSCPGKIPMKQHITSEPHLKKLRASSHKENSPPNASSTTVRSSESLPEEIADILVIRSNESLEGLFTPFISQDQSKNSQ